MMEHEDETLTSCVLVEPRVEGGGNISEAGLHFIAKHKYKPSEYTHLDNLLNPVWTWLTELLPVWLAPNMVTTLGGLHCGIAYAVLWWYSPDFNVVTPDWTVALAGWCIIAYYTLDCMDGKQARRTGSSSPLGQLFDHGFDCLCVQFFVANSASYAMLGGTYWFVALQTSLQLAFFMAQWEEYNTHILPHCAGKWCGVTEVNYAMGLVSIFNAFIDRDLFYSRPMKEMLAPLNEFGFSLDSLPPLVLNSELRQFLMCGWIAMSLTLMALSVRRVMVHDNIAGPKLTFSEVWRRRFLALSKLITPLALCIAAFSISPEKVRPRYITVPLGLCFSVITKKMIVFSMAKQTFGIIQLDALPFLLTAAWIALDDNISNASADFSLRILCVWYIFRLLRWASITINQICRKLDIYCFRLKKRKDE